MSALRGRRSAGLLLLLVVAFVASSCRFDGAYDLPLPGGKAVSSGDAITITAEFTDALNVVPRTAVMVDDVPVGQVSQVDRVGWHARVTMQVRKDLKLPANAAAEIRQTSLLGEKYVALIDPVGQAPTGRLSDGDNIPLADTSRNPEVEEVLGALSFVLSGGGIGQLHTISTELNKMMNGRTDEMRDVLGRINTLVAALDDQKDDIVTAMSAIDRLSATLNREHDTIGSAIDAIGPAVKVLDQQHRALVTMLRTLDELGAVGTRVIRGSRENLVATLRHLEPTLRELSDAGMSLPRGLGLLASFPFPKEAANLAMGDYANALFYMKFDLNKLFGSGRFGDSSNIPNPLEVCMVTPGAPVCQTLSDTALKQLCSVLPGNPLCAGIATKSPGSGSPGIGGLLGGLSSPSTSSSGTSTQPSGGGLLGLLGGGS